MGRSYTKRNQDYWNKVSQPRTVFVETSQASFDLPEAFEMSKGSFDSREFPETSRTSRRNRSAVSVKDDRFSQIRKMELPYKYKGSCVDIRDMVILCQKAYANVPIFRNAIDLMSEFANTDVYLEGGTKGSRDFFTRWFKKIGMGNLKDQAFREYYRSANVFLYRIDGEFSLEDFAKLSTIYAADGELNGRKIPIKYVLLNPYDMVANNPISFYDSGYDKILSGSELSRLKNPTSQEEVEILNGLPPDIQKQIKSGAFNEDGISINLEPQKLHYFAYKKQAYEPFGIPFGYPVLDDINAKIEMKRMDQALMRTVESVILHIKHGEKKDQYGGGINQKVGDALKTIFANGSTGRTIVTDYTVEGDFLIPDLKKVLGPEKYQILNQDIREGLQNVIIGEEKYGNTQTKIQVFLDKLKEARNAFLDNFLNPEIKRISKELGFKSFPIARLSDTEIKNNAEMMRVAVRLAELGILDPKSLIDTINHGEFPNIEDVQLQQEQFVADRKQGKWMPLSPVPVVASPADKLRAQQQKTGPAKQAAPVKSAGRPQGSKASIDSLKEIARAASNFQSSLEISLAKTYGVDSLDSSQKQIAQELAEKIISAVSPENWQSLAEECLANDKKIFSLQPTEEISTLSTETGLGDFESALYVWASES